MIGVLCPDHIPPSGGIRKIYRHVDILNEHGLDAAVVHHEPGFRCTWFDNETRVEHVGSAYASTIQLLVVPEVYGRAVHEIAPGLPKAILNQNAFNTFGTWTAEDPQTTPHADVLATIVVSDHNADYIRFAWPGHPVIRIRYGIDPRLYFPGGTPDRAVAFMPRKRASEAIQILQLLRQSGHLDGWELRPIDGVSESQAAAMLRRSAVFLSLSQAEGFGLPPAEAMASGCVVVGFHGFGGREFLVQPHAYPTEDGDVLGTAQTLAEVLSLFNRDPNAMRRIGLGAARFIQDRYAVEREAQDVVRTYGALVGLAQRSF